MAEHGKLVAGAAAVEITPKDSQFLFGYPHVERYSTGVHDPLMSSSLYVSDGATQAMFIANDIIFIPKQMAENLRQRIELKTSIPAANIMVTGTHTHSGPITVDYLSNEEDPIVPKADPAYLALMEDAIVESALKAHSRAEEAQIGLCMADGTGTGTNRRDPAGPSDPEVPVLLARSADGERNIALMLVCSMHPTVLHEDSTLVSGDFPGMARLYLQDNLLGANCPVLHHTGPAGNQSPRHVTRANTFEEAARLGAVLGTSVTAAVPGAVFPADITISCRRAFVDLPRRSFLPVSEAQERLDAVQKRLKELRDGGAPRQEVRTAECDLFGAEETLTLSKAAADDRLEETYATSLPAEVQAVRVGPWTFVGWAGEVFVDYALAVKEKLDNTFVVSCANGELQGYIVTPGAAAEGGYEASNALFAPESGAVLVETTLELLGEGV